LLNIWLQFPSPGRTRDLRWSKACVLDLAGPEDWIGASGKLAPPHCGEAQGDTIGLRNCMLYRSATI
jgi:hypothetical protein